jgi:anti-sigma factor RsiW
MADRFTARLSDYLDDEDLAADERREIEAHLATCSECRTTLAELREVAERAASAGDVPPQTDLWPGIAARLDSRAPATATPFAVARPPRRISFTVPQLVAAGLALMVLSGGSVWLVRHGGSQTDFEPLAAQSVPDPTGTANGAITDVALDDPDYDGAIADLERTLQAGRDRLSPETIRAIEANLQAIDSAIEQCRRALASDPASVYLNNHLAAAQRRKLTLLRRATALTATRS